MDTVRTGFKANGELSPGQCALYDQSAAGIFHKASDEMHLAEANFHLPTSFALLG